MKIPIILLLTLSILTLGNVSRAQSQPQLIKITPIRELIGTTTDFDAPIGSSAAHDGFAVECGGSHVRITDNNPDFTLWQADEFDCPGGMYWVSYIFTPSQPGLTYAEVTFSFEGKTQKSTLIGNGIITEQADYWIADLGPGTSANRLVYDNQRSLIYVTDAGNNKIIVFSPSERRVINTVDVGLDPVGLALTPDNKKLYVANSGEHTISVVDLSTQTESDRIEIPTLYPNPFQDYQFYYMPWEITVVSDTLALLGSAPPGRASGEHIYELNLVTKQATPRYDYPNMGLGARPVFRTNRDFTATGIVVEPASSPTQILRYDIQKNSFKDTMYGLERTIAINNNGSRLITTNNDCNTLQPNLSIFDQFFNLLTKVQLSGCQSLSLIYNPINPNYVYAVDGREEGLLEIARLDLGRQTKKLTFEVPPGYYQHDSHAMTISDDGMWVYMPLVQTWDAPPSKLLAVRVGPTEYKDDLAPISAMQPLSESQVHNWWAISWVGSDNNSGIDHYEVEFRVGEDGVWKRWLKTKSTHGLFFNAIPSQKYFFRTIALDNAGNIELYPEAFDTFTTAGNDATGLQKVFLPYQTK